MNPPIFLRTTVAQAALLALLKHSPAQSSADLAEGLVTVGRAETVPSRFWSSVTPQTVFGILRRLECSDQVRRAGVKVDTRAGRDVPVWVLVNPASVAGDLPPVFEDVDPTPDAPGDAQAQDPDPDPKVLLSAFDELAGIVGRQRRELDRIAALVEQHKRDVDDFVDRLRVRLGMGVVDG